ncbi:hypothetical protein [Methylotenera versatilis]|uniref:hypothetical protein n=1 Tax=Methylotenera versatilis TaxID=1055487 RepID=UPI0006457265|nr:hypothetical protein [Methylotenera versatilis]
MLIKHVKTSKDLSDATFVDIPTILREVKEHGFYSAYCVNLVPDIVDHLALISEINHMARRANLRVTFNSEESICVFENKD